MRTNYSRPIAAFLARARRALNSTFSATYELSIPYRSGARRAQVVAAQLANRRIFYRQLPGLSAAGMGQVNRTPGGFEVFEGANSDGRGIFSCTEARTSSHWSCVGPYTGIGMGGMEALMGPYPLQALELGLDNATVTYTGAMATEPEPTRLVWRRLRAHRVQCIDFGESAHLLGSVCLNRAGLVASYDLPPSVTASTYDTAELRNYSPHLNVDTFTLPVKPTAFPTLRRPHVLARAMHTCRTSQLKITIGSSFAGLGSAGANIRFINKSTATCDLHGWPTLIAETAGAAHTRALDRPGMYFADVTRAGVPTVILKPDQRAGAIFDAADGSPSDKPCGPGYRTLRVTAPGNTNSVTISAWIGYLGQFLPSCSAIQISPVLPSAAVYKG